MRFRIKFLTYFILFFGLGVMLLRLTPFYQWAVFILPFHVIVFVALFNSLTCPSCNRHLKLLGGMSRAFFKGDCSVCSGEGQKYKDGA